MKSARRGQSTSGVELSNVSQHGLWLLVDGHEAHLAEVYGNLCDGSGH